MVQIKTPSHSFVCVCVCVCTWVTCVGRWVWTSNPRAPGLDITSLLKPYTSRKNLSPTSQFTNWGFGPLYILKTSKDIDRCCVVVESSIKLSGSYCRGYQTHVTEFFKHKVLRTSQTPNETLKPLNRAAAPLDSARTCNPGNQHSNTGLKTP